jgi:hypothetical protein
LSGINKGATFMTGGMKVMVTMCPIQQTGFRLFLRGAKNRMGYVSQRNQPLGLGVIKQLLRAIKEEVEEQDAWVAWEYIKVGAAAALAICASLWGPEVFLLDLAGLWKYGDLGKDGVLPEDPLKISVDLLQVLYIIVTLIGKFKGDLGT